MLADDTNVTQKVTDTNPAGPKSQAQGPVVPFSLPRAPPSLAGARGRLQPGQGRGPQDPQLCTADLPPQVPAEAAGQVPGQGAHKRHPVTHP